jgi:ornithine decarboxylase/arginine decarboxylase
MPALLELEQLCFTHPGERFNRKICDYLRFTREFNAAFPGFDTDVHGLVEEDVPGEGRRYYVDCIQA